MNSPTDNPNPNTPLEPIEEGLSDELTDEEKRAIDENIERFVAQLNAKKAAEKARAEKWEEDAKAEKDRILAEIAAEREEKPAREEKEKSRWTAQQIQQCARSMMDDLSREEADALSDLLFEALGEDSFMDLCGSDAVGAELKRLEEQARLNAKAKAQVKAVEKREAKRVRRKANPIKPAKRVSKSPEVWRCLDSFPSYEISSHGRVRCIDRARADDWIKPRGVWRKGVYVQYVVLYDKDRVRRERMVGYLLISAGFEPRPKWMK